MSETTIEELIGIIKEEKGVQDLDVDMLLIDSGFLDSFDIITVIAKIEEHFQVSIPGEDVVPENLNRICDIVALVERLRSAL
ncbi:MAG: acyl carrier protein [Proteobacteria bacterium]|nr:acyl carrier protein [Pseudomonadota bacterium]